MWALRVCWVLLGTLGAGSAQLLFRNITSATMGPCNETAILPCFVTNLKINRFDAMFVKWKVNENEFFSFDGPQKKVTKNITFQSAELVDQSMLVQGIASLLLLRDEAVPGNYSCEVVESNREGVQIIELRYKNVSSFEPWEDAFIVATIILAAIFYWIQLGIVATKFDMTLIKKVSLSCAGLIVTVAVVVGSILLLRGKYSTSSQIGLGLIIFPSSILVPLLVFLLRSVFEKLPHFAVVLAVLKAVGFLIALTGFAIAVSGCLLKQATAMIVGLLVIDIVAAIGVIYVIVVGSNLKDHQPPRMQKE